MSARGGSPHCVHIGKDTSRQSDLPHKLFPRHGFLENPSELGSERKMGPPSAMVRPDGLKPALDQARLDI